MGNSSGLAGYAGDQARILGQKVSNLNVDINQLIKVIETNNILLMLNNGLIEKEDAIKELNDIKTESKILKKTL